MKLFYQLRQAAAVSAIVLFEVTAYKRDLSVSESCCLHSQLHVLDLVSNAVFSALFLNLKNLSKREKVNYFPPWPPSESLFIKF